MCIYICIMALLVSCRVHQPMLVGVVQGICRVDVGLVEGF